MIKEKKIVLQRSGQIDPESLADYKKHAGFTALRQAFSKTPKEVIETIKKSGLRGRGGAGFPTGMKQQFTFDAEGSPKYLICNADEGEPGTFKDRIIMEKDPFALIEGMIISAYAIQASHAYVYIRGEYYESINRIKNAIDQCYKNGYLGENILKKGYNLNMNIKLGAGSYLCGEELTLIESMEGKRGNPRFKPPFPAQKGFFQKPTLVNNVETLATIPHIINKGAEWFQQRGLEKSPGTKIFCLSGDIKKPGVYEAETTVTLQELIYDFGKGLKDNAAFKVALTGGAAGTFAGTDMFDVPMGYDEYKEKGCTIGSGAVIVFNQSRSMDMILGSLIDFFQHESCGKCVPCRVGCKHLSLKAESLSQTDRLQQKKKLDDMVFHATSMAKTSLCPLGQSPILPLQSALDNFDSLF